MEQKRRINASRKTVPIADLIEEFWTIGCPAKAKQQLYLIRDEIWVTGIADLETKVAPFLISIGTEATAAEPEHELRKVARGTLAGIITTCLLLKFQQEPIPGDLWRNVMAFFAQSDLHCRQLSDKETAALRNFLRESSDRVFMGWDQPELARALVYVRDHATLRNRSILAAIAPLYDLHRTWMPDSVRDPDLEWPAWNHPHVHLEGKEKDTVLRDCRRIENIARASMTTGTPAIIDADSLTKAGATLLYLVSAFRADRGL